MVSFQQYKPYYFNWELLEELLLKPALDNQTAINKKEMAFRDFLDVIADKDYIFHCSNDWSTRTVSVTIGDNNYIFEEDLAGRLLGIALEAINNVGNYIDVANCMWLYIESDTIIDDPHFFYMFFLCKGENIILPSISLSDTLSRELPSDIFEKQSEPFLNNEEEDTKALVRLCYEKWEKGTPPGRIYAMKEKMQCEQEFAEYAGRKVDDSNNIIGNNIFLEISKLRHELTSVKYILLTLIFLITFWSIDKLFF